MIGQPKTTITYAYRVHYGIVGQYKRNAEFILDKLLNRESMQYEAEKLVREMSFQSGVEYELFGVTCTKEKKIETLENQVWLVINAVP